MVWYFNFCSPHLTDDDTVNLNRTLMVVQIVIAMLGTFFVHMMAELYDEQASRVKNEVDPKEDIGNEKAQIDQDSAFELHKGYDDGEVKTKMGFTTKLGFTSKNLTTAKISRRAQEPGFFKTRKVFFLTVETVENRAPIFFGHFSIALASCILYAPFTMQALMGLFYVICAIAMLIFEAWKYERLLTISVGICYLINLALVASSVVGLGLANFDLFTINCYYTKLGM